MLYSFIIAIPTKNISNKNTIILLNYIVLLIKQRQILQKNKRIL